MALRFQRKTVFADAKNVTTYEGVDPLTGLSVLIYAFAGGVASGLAKLESENIPGLLATDESTEQSQIVVSYPRSYAPLGTPLGVRLGQLLTDSARALVDAARAGVVHGDLQPERFWGASDHVILEGFGAPWRLDGEASLANDIKDWAKSVEILTSGAVSPDLAELLKRCQAAPSARPSAQQLCDELQTFKDATLTRAQTLQDIQLDFEVDTGAPAASPFDIALDDVPAPVTAPAATSPTATSSSAPPDGGRVVSGLPQGARDLSRNQRAAGPDFDLGMSDVAPDDSNSGSTQKTTDFGIELDDDLPVTPVTRQKASQPLPNNDALLDRNTQTGENKATFVKNLPPGATFRAGEAGSADAGRAAPLADSFEEELKAPTRSRRPLIIVLGATVGALIIAAIAFLGQGVTPYSVPETAVNYLVTVQIEPPNLPPVEVVVVASPPASRHRPGALLGSYGSGSYQLPLDEVGAWQLQGRFQDITSEVVSLSLPEQRGAVITMPALLEPEPVDEEDAEQP